MYKRQELLHHIIDSQIPSLKIVGHAGDKSEAIRLLSKKEVDLVFLDIHLRDCNAFDILDIVQRTDLKIIFTTAYDKYALRAFDYWAVGYVLKPYSPDAIRRAVERVLNQDLPKTELTKISGFMETLMNRPKEIISLSTHDGIERINKINILRVEADRAYCKIYLVDGNNIIVSKSLSCLLYTSPSPRD